MRRLNVWHCLVLLAFLAGNSVGLRAGEPAPQPTVPGTQPIDNRINPPPNPNPNVEPEPEPPPVPPEQEIDPFAPRGVGFAKLRFYPAFNYELTYTDNAARAQRNADADILHEYAPSVDIRYRPTDLISYGLLYEFGWHDYAHDEAKDYVSHRIVTELNLRNLGIEGMFFTLGDSYLQSGNTSALENELLSFTRFHSNRAYAQLGYRYNRFAISGKYTHSFTDYFARAAAISDYLTHAGEIEGEYSFIPERVILYGLFNFTRTLRNVTDVDDFDTHTLLTGVRGRWSKLTYSMAVGYTEADFINRDQHDDGPAALGTLTYQPHSRLLFGLNVSRRFMAGALQGITTESNVGVNAAVQLTARGRFTAAYQRNESDRQDGPRLLSQQFDAGFEWKFTRYAAARVGYTHTERENSSGANEFIENQARFGFRISW